MLSIFLPKKLRTAKPIERRIEMTITPFMFGVLACLASETIVAIVFGCIGHIIGKVNEGKFAREALNEIIERTKDGRIDE